MRTFYLDNPLDEGDLARVEDAVNSEGHEIELAEVISEMICINVHNHTTECDEALKYFLGMAGCKVLEIS